MTMTVFTDRGWRSFAKPNLSMSMNVNEKGILGEDCNIAQFTNYSI